MSSRHAKWCKAYKKGLLLERTSQKDKASAKITMFRLLLLVCVGVVAVRANLTGVTVATGDCLCVSGTGVNARDHGESRAVAFLAKLKILESLEILVKIKSAVCCCRPFSRLVSNFSFLISRILKTRSILRKDWNLEVLCKATLILSHG